MKKIFGLAAVLCALSFVFSVQAQIAPPAGGGDRDLRDTNVKGRSNELERINRAAGKESKKKNDEKSNAQTPQPAEDKLALKYPEIKEDYELMQTAQTAIIQAYTNGEKINYAQLVKSSADVNKSAVRLSANLFPAPVENAEMKKDDKKAIEKPAAAKSLRDLIVELDNAVGSFISSPMFQNLRTVDPKVGESAKNDLEKVERLSAELKMEAEKMSLKQK